MKPQPIALLALVLTITGCSNTQTEISPQEKRNNFDACVLDFMANPKNQGVSSWKFDREAFRQAGELACRDLLK